MEFTVINGEIAVGEIDITFVSTASTFMVGDIATVSLNSAFEGPPEDVIVGVSLPILPPIIPTIP